MFLCELEISRHYWPVTHSRSGASESVSGFSIHRLHMGWKYCYFIRITVTYPSKWIALRVSSLDYRDRSVKQKSFSAGFKSYTSDIGNTCVAAVQFLSFPLPALESVVPSSLCSSKVNRRACCTTLWQHQIYHLRIICNFKLSSTSYVKHNFFLA